MECQLVLRSRWHGLRGTMSLHVGMPAGMPVCLTFGVAREQRMRCLFKNGMPVGVSVDTLLVCAFAMMASSSVPVLREKRGSALGAPRRDLQCLPASCDADFHAVECVDSWDYLNEILVPRSVWLGT